MRCARARSLSSYTTPSSYEATTRVRSSTVSSHAGWSRFGQRGTRRRPTCSCARCRLRCCACYRLVRPPRRVGRTRKWRSCSRGAVGPPPHPRPTATSPPPGASGRLSLAVAVALRAGGRWGAAGGRRCRGRRLCHVPVTFASKQGLRSTGRCCGTCAGRTSRAPTCCGISAHERSCARPSRPKSSRSGARSGSPAPRRVEAVAEEEQPRESLSGRRGGRLGRAGRGGGGSSAGGDGGGSGSGIEWNHQEFEVRYPSSSAAPCGRSLSSSAAGWRAENA